jgi:hypothetical protein
MQSDYFRSCSAPRARLHERHIEQSDSQVYHFGSDRGDLAVAILQLRPRWLDSEAERLPHRTIRWPNPS